MHQVGFVPHSMIGAAMVAADVQLPAAVVEVAARSIHLPNVDAEVVPHAVALG